MKYKTRSNIKYIFSYYKCNHNYVKNSSFPSGYFFLFLLEINGSPAGRNERSNFQKDKFNKYEEGNSGFSIVTFYWNVSQ